MTIFMASPRHAFLASRKPGEQVGECLIVRWRRALAPAPPQAGGANIARGNRFQHQTVRRLLDAEAGPVTAGHRFPRMTGKRRDLDPGRGGNEHMAAFIHRTLARPIAGNQEMAGLGKFAGAAP